jgi:hypothetical protein
LKKAGRQTIVRVFDSGDEATDDRSGEAPTPSLSRSRWSLLEVALEEGERARRMALSPAA